MYSKLIYICQIREVESLLDKRGVTKHKTVRRMKENPVFVQLGE